MAHKVHRPHNFRALSKPKPLQKREQRHYWPYMPVLLLVIGTFLLSLAQPVQRHRVLSYATDVSATGLLQATNEQRGKNAAGSLQLSTGLNAAAQAKANDMIARNYWSHTTPDGQQPWVFIDNVGYKYQKAGENLAYGFSDSTDTVTGWMNSASHRANLLDSSFTEVGFGFANSEDFNHDGAETVVVAMYAQPHVLAASSTASTPASASPAPSSSQAVPVAQAGGNQASAKSVPVTSEASVLSEPATTAVARVQTLTKGQAPWALFAVGLITGLAVAALLMKHAAGLRHLLRDSERFVLHHPLLDTILVSLVMAGSFLSQTTGFIR